MSVDDPRVQSTLEVEGGAVYRVTAATTLNLRRSPNTSAEVVAELCRGELDVGVQQHGEWMLVFAPARAEMGYAAAKWLK